MILYCPVRGNCCIDALVCLYICPNRTKLKCATYDKEFDNLTTLTVDEKYVGRYGSPSLPVPRSRKKKATTPVKTKPTKKVKVAAPVKEEPKRKRSKATEEAIPASPVKAKRKRRTKKEMEEARAKEAKRGR